MGFDLGDLKRLGKKLILGDGDNKAPILGNLLGGTAAGKAVGIISSILGCKDDPKEIERVLEANVKHRFLN